MAAPAVAVPETTSPRPDRRYLYGLDALRILAALFIIYRHVGEWLWANGHRWPVDAWLGEAFREPLRLNTFFGFVGLSTLFLISGLVVTYVTDRERPVQFLLRRAARLLPAFWVAVCVAWVLVALGLVAALGDAEADPNSLLGSLTLANFFLSEQRIVLGVTWTLTVQLTFFVYVGLTLPWGRRWPWLPPAVAATALSVALSVVNTIDGIPAYHLRTILTYLPVLFVGQLVSLVRTGRLRAGMGVTLGAAHFLLFVRAGLTSELIPEGEGHVRTLLITTLVVVLLLSADGRLVRSPLVGAVARRTYALYLIHVPVGFAVLGLLAPRTHLAVALPAALVAMGAAAELLHRYVEMPCHRWYRARERRRGAGRVPPPGGTVDAPSAVVGTANDIPPAGTPRQEEPGTTTGPGEDDQHPPDGGAAGGVPDQPPDTPDRTEDVAAPASGSAEDDDPASDRKGGTAGSPDDAGERGDTAVPGCDGADVPAGQDGGATRSDPEDDPGESGNDDTAPAGHQPPPAGAPVAGVLDPLDATSPPTGAPNVSGEGR